MPLALLQNSIKYSSADNVKLTIQEISNKYQVSVESVGPLIEVDELVNIFKKGVRGKWAEKKTNEGLGIGLYIASMVAVAHNLRIDCVSEPMGYNRDDIPQARNTFSFCLPLVGETL